MLWAGDDGFTSRVGESSGRSGINACPVGRFFRDLDGEPMDPDEFMRQGGALDIESQRRLLWP